MELSNTLNFQSFEVVNFKNTKTYRHTTITLLRWENVITLSTDSILFTEKISKDQKFIKRKYYPIIVIKNPLQQNNWIVVDGNHRLASFIKRNEKFIDCKILTKDNFKDATGVNRIPKHIKELKEGMINWDTFVSLSLSAVEHSYDKSPIVFNHVISYLRENKERQP